MLQVILTYDPLGPPYPSNFSYEVIGDPEIIYSPCCKRISFLVTGLEPWDIEAGDFFNAVANGQGVSLISEILNFNNNLLPPLLSSVIFTINVCSNLASNTVIMLKLGNTDFAFININDLVNIIPNPLTASPVLLDFGAGVVLVGDSTTLDITVNNTSSQAIVLDVVLNNLCAGLSIVGGNTVTIPPLISTIGVTFTPLTANTFVACNLVFNIPFVSGPSCPMLIVDVRGQSYVNLIKCLRVAVTEFRALEGYIVSVIDPPVSIEEGCCKEFCIAISFPELEDCSLLDLTYETQGEGFGVGLPLFNVNNNTIDFSIRVCNERYIGFVIPKLIILCNGNPIVEIPISILVSIIPFSIIATPAILDFGPVLINTTAVLPVTVTNSSALPMDIVASLSGPLCTDLTILGSNILTVLANSFITVNIQFAPILLGINLSCSLTLASRFGCSARKIEIIGRSADHCTFDTIAVNPQDCCPLPNESICTSPFTSLHKAFADFYNCTDTNLLSLNEKLKNTGLFGLFDKSKKAANDINDIHYLSMLLYMMWTEKVEDAMGKCECCRYSKHPKYYIDKYNIECVFEYFRCKNIDISCYLKAFKVDKVFHISQLSYQSDGNQDIALGPVSSNNFLWNITLGFQSAEQFVDCAEMDIKDCCPLDGIGSYPSDWIYLHLLNYAECIVGPNELCEYPQHTTNLDEDFGMYTYNLNEEFNCNKTFTFNLNEKPC